MKKTQIWLRHAAVAAAGLAILGSASPAMATISGSNGGVGFTTNSAETILTVRDKAMDGFSVNGDYYVNGSAGMKTLNVNGGKNDEESTGEYDDGINKARGCVVKPVVADACTGWYS
jgi:hypothetical protein